MWVKGCRETITLFLLVDSGSSHNFLDKKVVKELGYKMESIPTLMMAVVNGNEIICEEICRNFWWGILGYQFQADFFILPLDIYNLIYKYNILITELVDSVEFQTVAYEIWVSQQEFLIQGEGDQSLRMVSKENMQKLFRKNTQLT